MSSADRPVKGRSTHVPLKHRPRSHMRIPGFITCVLILSAGVLARHLAERARGPPRRGDARAWPRQRGCSPHGAPQDFPPRQPLSSWKRFLPRAGRAARLPAARGGEQPLGATATPAPGPQQRRASPERRRAAPQSAAPPLPPSRRRAWLQRLQRP